MVEKYAVWESTIIYNVTELFGNLKNRTEFRFSPKTETRFVLKHRVPIFRNKGKNVEMRVWNSSLHS